MGTHAALARTTTDAVRVTFQVAAQVRGLTAGPEGTISG
jgi:hypothetical protein